jgi:starch synthase
VKVLFATAEYAPVARVGGLAQAAAGLVAALRELDIDVEVVLPDYAATPLEDETFTTLAVPPWAGPATARHGHLDGVGPITLVSASGIERSHPYLEPAGQGWPDNDHRFLAFSAAVAALTEQHAPDILHLNDWHTAGVLAFLGAPRPPTVLTIHTLAYQGRTSPGWLAVIPNHRAAFTHDGDFNPMAGAIRLSELVITVSPTYASEILTRREGAGLQDVLQQAGPGLVGILNGIDTTVWDPATDSHLAATYTTAELKRKRRCRKAVRTELGLPDDDSPLVVMVTRLVDQKGVDLALACVPFLERMPAQLAVLGDGDEALAWALHRAAEEHPGVVAFHRGYDESLAHRLFGGGDLLLMPSRFEPCGLAQMQAMRYGTLPVVTDVGGLHDTVVDLDTDPARGTGIVAAEVSVAGVVDALHRAGRMFADRERRDSARVRGMTADWSWQEPALEHVRHYERLVGSGPPAATREETT